MKEAKVAAKERQAETKTGTGGSPSVPPAPEPLPTNPQWREQVRQRRAPEIAGYAAARGLSVEEWERQANAHLERLLADVIPYRRDEASEILAILKDGVYRTLFETGMSTGINSKTIRRRVEGVLFGYPDDLPPVERPVYGYFDPSPNGRSTTPSSLDQYGEVATHFKNTIRGRATFTVGDTVDETEQGREPNLVALPLSSPGWEAVASSVGDILNYATIHDLMRYIEHGDPNDEDAPLVGYIEAHFHGGLSLEEVEELILYSEQPPFKRAMKAAKAASIKYRMVK